MTFLPSDGGVSFDVLPSEVLRSILGYMDIPSLAALSATHKAECENVAFLASDDVTWYALVQNRFGIGCNHRRNTRRKQKDDGVVVVKRSLSSSCASCLLPADNNGNGHGGNKSADGGRRYVGRKRRPTTYGGAKWKDAYRCLSTTMRIPETSVTSGGQNPGGGAVFASPRLRGRNNNNNNANGTGSGRCSENTGRRSSSMASVADFCGVWCMVSHAENCRTKTVEGAMGRRRGRAAVVGSRRQRTTGHRGVAARESPRAAASAAVTLPYRSDRRYIELKVCLQNTKSGFGRVVVPDVSAIRVVSPEEEDYFSSWGWDKWDDEDYDATFRLVEAGPWAPKIVLRRQFGREHDAVREERDAFDAEAWNSDCDSKDLILSPFEVVVLSLHVSCPDGFVYETDVLSSMSSIRVPVVADGWQSTVDRGHEEGWSVKTKDVSTASFLSEDALWEYYCQLPGGCLSLTDRSRLVPV